MTPEELQKSTAAPDTTGNTPATPEPAKPKAEDTVEYWKEQYNGKNGTAVKLQRMYADTLAEKETLAQKLSQIEVESQAKIQTYEEQMRLAAKKADEAIAQAQKYEKATSVRSKINSDDFKILADLYDDDDVLNLAVKYTDDELTAYLTKQKGKLEKFTKNTTEERNLGSTPTPPPAGQRGTTQVSTADTADALEKATLKGFNSPEYQAAFQAHIAAVMASSQQQ